MKYKKKSLFDDALSIGKTSIVTGVMGSAVTKAGGNAAGLQTLSGYYPVISTIKGGGHALSMLDNMLPMRKKKK